MNWQQLFFKQSQILGLILSMTLSATGLATEAVSSEASASLKNALRPEEEEQIQKSLDDNLRALASPDAEKRLAAAEQIVNANPKVVEIYLQALNQPLPENRYPIISLRAMIWAIWGQFPNPFYPKGKAPMWFIRHQPKSPPKKHSQLPPAMDPNAKALEHDPDAVDWLKALASVDEKEWRVALNDLAKEKVMILSNPKGIAPFSMIRAQMLFRVALLKALGQFGSQGMMQVVRPVFDFAFLHQGTFRDECGRDLRNMGEYAVPELSRLAYTRYGLLDREAKKKGIIVEKDKDRDSKIRYANYQLERLDRQSAKKALKNAPTQAMQVELLHVYGDVQYRNAVEPVLSYVNDPSPSVRNAARGAWMRYVEGPAPDPAPGHYWKHPGGIVDAHTTPDYANFRQLAEAFIRKRLEEQKLLKGEPSLKQMTSQLFSYYDDEREHQLDRLFEQAKIEERAKHFKQATDVYQWILAQQPKFPQRAEMADAFYQLGEANAQIAEQKNDQKLISQALGLLHKSLLLDPNHPEHARIQARIHYLDGKQSQALGGDGLSDFQLSLQADPTYTEAKRELDRAKK